MAVVETLKCRGETSAYWQRWYECETPFFQWFQEKARCRIEYDHLHRSVFVSGSPANVPHVARTVAVVMGAWVFDRTLTNHKRGAANSSMNSFILPSAATKPLASRSTSAYFTKPTSRNLMFRGSFKDVEALEKSGRNLCAKNIQDDEKDEEMDIKDSKDDYEEDTEDTEDTDDDEEDTEDGDDYEEDTEDYKEDYKEDTEDYKDKKNKENYEKDLKKTDKDPLAAAYGQPALNSACALNDACVDPHCCLLHQCSNAKRPGFFCCGGKFLPPEEFDVWRGRRTKLCKAYRMQLRAKKKQKLTKKAAPPPLVNQSDHRAFVRTCRLWTCSFCDTQNASQHQICVGCNNRSRHVSAAVAKDLCRQELEAWQKAGKKRRRGAARKEEETIPWKLATLAQCARSWDLKQESAICLQRALRRYLQKQIQADVGEVDVDLGITATRFPPQGWKDVWSAAPLPFSQKRKGVEEDVAKATAKQREQMRRCVVNGALARPIVVRMASDGKKHAMLAEHF